MLARWSWDAAWAADIHIALFDDNDSVKNNQFMLDQGMVAVEAELAEIWRPENGSGDAAPVGLLCSEPGLNSIWPWQKESIKLLAADLHRHLLIGDSCHIPMSADVCAAKMNAKASIVD